MTTNDAPLTYPAGLAPLAEFRFRLRQFLNFSETECERAGIQTQQYQLLQVLAAAPSPDQTSISYIAERMLLRHNSTVELVDRAERAGLVSRHTDSRDLRRSIIKLTDKGATVFRELLVPHLAEVKRSAQELIQALQGVTSQEME